MKKWKYLDKCYGCGVIAMTAVQICTASGRTRHAHCSEVTPRNPSSTRFQAGLQVLEITSETGVLMDADSGTLLYSKGGDEIRYPASITKNHDTGLLAVENCP